MTLYALDPDAAAALDKFRSSAPAGLEQAWEQLLDRSRATIVNQADFVAAAAELGYSEAEAEQIFELLCLKPNSGSITLREVAFLQGWEDAKQDIKDRARLTRHWVNRDPYADPGRTGGQQAAGATAQEAVGGSSPSCATSAWPWAERVATDGEDLWENFKEFLLDRYKTLPNAWDAMDTRGSGTLSLREFQAMVVNELRYCRASEAKRLFSLASPDGEPLTWKDFGVTPQEMIEHGTEKQMRQQHLRSLGKAGRGGANVRSQDAVAGHMRRIKKQVPKPELFFGTTPPAEPG
eukprot:CAMPEP_0179192340 /NCGR_PEP_ID=MMETSP0796-20121207/95560_1 /TAXON_ID=73915 /ORGANISM="Pyrodinium bahamense, Strain pbaha01" /LENGTH=292 /DNA_ID=CAMNT_0020896609 /DNA_START=21 /DNA_END=896 /DNA_ORIENTATION=+